MEKTKNFTFSPTYIDVLISFFAILYVYLISHDEKCFSVTEMRFSGVGNVIGFYVLFSAFSIYTHTRTCIHTLFPTCFPCVRFKRKISSTHIIVSLNKLLISNSTHRYRLLLQDDKISKTNEKNMFFR